MSRPTRLEQLGTLLTAMIAVIVGGSAADLLDPPIYSAHLELKGVDLREFRRGGRYFGVYARVARKCGVSRPNVTYVAQGKGSRRILRAIIEEIQAVDRAPSSEGLAPLSQTELRCFNRGSRYFGAYTRVADRLGMEHSNVWRVAHGSKSQRVLRAIREEMARVDAEVAAKEGQL